MDQGAILRLRVADDNIIVGDEEDVAHLPLGGEGLTGAGGAENQAVGILQQLPVHHDEVVGKSVQPAVEGLFTGLKQFLRREGDKNSDA